MSNEPNLPPRAKAVPYTFTHLGHTLTDEYSWLQNPDDPEVLAYLEAENAYARGVLQQWAGLEDRLFHEMRGRIQEDDSSAPQLRGGYYYYSRMEQGRQYRVFCRKKGSLDAPEQVLLDENELAVGHTYCRVLSFEPSPDHTLLAFSVDTTGARIFELYVKDMRTGRLLSGPINGTAWSVAWAGDNRTVFYTLLDAAHRPYKLMRHTAGSDPAGDVLVYHEPDDAYTMRVNRSRTGAFILLTLNSHSTSEVRYLPADRPEEELRTIHPREHWLEYYVEPQEDRFLIRTNDHAENFKLMEAPLAAPGKENWREVLPVREDTLIENLAAFRTHLVLHERRAGLQLIRLSDPDGLSNVRYVSMPEPVYSYSVGVYFSDVNTEWDTTTLRFFYSSLVTPLSTIDYDVQSGAWQVMKQQEIPSGYDPSQYVSERRLATAPDGAQVPISLVYRKGLTLDGSHPLLLEGYGSYGYSADADFHPNRLSLLDRGYLYAIAHVRGGSELGRSWYNQGRLLHKVNSFTDLIACAEHLIAAGYTAPKRVAIMGASAGGLLVAAAATMRPDLFQSVIALVPFTNVITAILMPDLPLTVIEYEQWGHPDDPEAFAYMLSYSPYEHVEAKAYPNLFVRAGLHDLQVPYWDPAKWVARLRAHKTDDNCLLLLTNMGAGHGGASGRYDSLHEVAEAYAFLIETMG